MRRNVLILGGTKDARELADLLVASGDTVTTSIAGVTESPALPNGRIRVGGFGGAKGLRDYLVAEDIQVLVDATHPFATFITRNATAAVEGLNIVHVRLDRPAWQSEASDNWLPVPDIISAVGVLPTGAHVFLTIGRKEVAPFLKREDLSGVVRMIEPPQVSVPPHWKLLLERPPGSLEQELEVFRKFGITHLVSKNSGGHKPYKIVAAGTLGIPVVMVARPVKSGGVVVPDIAGAVRVIHNQELQRKN
jgi:precorrin-6A/cobalt-precorrin-6A reductase